MGEAMTPLENYLRYYVTLKEPRYAVLVTGEWGVGKTFQVRDILGRIDKECSRRDPLNPSDHAYVSLFGTSTPDQVDAEVLSAVSAKADFAAKAANFLDRISSRLPGSASAVAIASVAAGPIMRRAIEGSNHRLLVFDDLERSTMESKQLLGVINRYIEQLGFSVIVIAHDEKLFNEFTEAKEKLIGQTIAVVPNLTSAFSAFLIMLQNEEQRQFVSKYSSVVINSFNDSQINSLRILRHVIEDIARLYTTMSKSQRVNEAACAELLKWFALANSLVRGGCLSRENIRNPQAFGHALYERKKTEGYEPNPAERAVQEALEIQLYRLDFHKGDLAERMLFDGVYDAAEISAHLAGSFPFRPFEAPPSWQIVWYRHRASVADFIAAFEDMEKRFSNREYVAFEDVLHVFALRLHMADESMYASRTVDQVKEECLQYLQHLSNSGLISEDPNLYEYSIDSLSGAYGLGFSVGEAGLVRETFEELIEAYRGLVSKANEDGLEVKAKKLMSFLPSDPNGFLDQLSQQEYTRFPILNVINVDQFIDAILDTPLDGWLFIAEAIRGRHDHVHEIFQDEVDWLNSLIEKLDMTYERYIGSEKTTDRFIALRLKWFMPPNLRERVAVFIEDRTRNAASDAAASSAEDAAAP